MILVVSSASDSRLDSLSHQFRVGSCDWWHIPITTEASQVNLLLEAKASQEPASDNLGRACPLHFAAGQGHLEVVPRLACIAGFSEFSKNPTGVESPPTCSSRVYWIGVFFFSCFCCFYVFAVFSAFVAFMFLLLFCFCCFCASAAVLFVFAFLLFVHVSFFLLFAFVAFLLLQLFSFIFLFLLFHLFAF